MKLKVFFVMLLMVSGCAQSSDTHNTKSPANPNAQDPAPADPQQNSNPIQGLKIDDGTNGSINKFQAVNVEPGKFFFDFDYAPTQNEDLTLVYNSVKSTLIGCADSDIAFDFTLHQKNADGKIDLNAYKGLGPAPVGVAQGTPYIVRVSLDVRKSCLGIAYSFIIKSSN